MALSFIWANVVNLAPELGALPTGAQTEILAVVGNEVSEINWDAPADADDAGKYLAAHLGTLWRMRGSGGVTGEALGAASRAYAMPRGDLNASLALTAYGAEYERRVRMQSSALGIVV